ncbi:hypothetical protein [Streptomyces sp. TP-A0356]|uniref:hypothetical protein n=1 Tax=Streptomyces sp. TP-A0356 TaxID=1359208 RepID=UPI0006E3CCC0|nr:hypothetical protein [Streptomyces sp. TP-A0356]
MAVEVQPDPGDTGDVRLTVRHFRFSPPGARPMAEAGRGVARLYLDGRSLTRLRTVDHHLPGHHGVGDRGEAASHGER